MTTCKDISVREGTNYQVDESETMLSNYELFLKRQGVNKIKDFRAFQVFVEKRSEEKILRENLFATVQEKYQSDLQSFKLPHQTTEPVRDSPKKSLEETHQPSPDPAQMTHDTQFVDHVSTLGSLLKSP
jgi:hypothetical protein